MYDPDNALYEADILNAIDPEPTSTDTRKRLAVTLAERLINKRLESSNLIEQARARAINALIEKIPDLSDRQLLNLVIALGDQSKNDVDMVVGRGDPKDENAGGSLLNINILSDSGNGAPIIDSGGSHASSSVLQLIDGLLQVSEGIVEKRDNSE